MKLTSFTAWHLVMQTLSQSFCSSTKPYIFSGIPLATIPMASPLIKITSDPLNSGTRIKPTLSPICVCRVGGGGSTDQSPFVTCIDAGCYLTNSDK